MNALPKNLHIDDNLVADLLRNIDPNKINSLQIQSIAQKLVQSRVPAITNPQEPPLSKKRLKLRLNAMLIKSLILEKQLEALGVFTSDLQNHIDLMWQPKFETIVNSIRNLSDAVDATYIYTSAWFQDCPASTSAKRDFCSNLVNATIKYGQNVSLWTAVQNLSFDGVLDLITYKVKGAE